jgi:oxygen-dependent protoporphyrinogen oxidase
MDERMNRSPNKNTQAANFGRADVVILGAGITGLSAARFLEDKGIASVILEKDTRPGGTIRTDRVDGFLVESGPNSALDTSPFLHELFGLAGVEASLEYANGQSNNRYILRDGRLNNLPMNPVAFVKTPLFSASSKLRLLKEPFVAPSDPDEDVTLAEFVRRRLGEEFLDYAINPFVAGVYAGNPEDLSVRSGFPKLWELEQKYGSLIKGAVWGARERRKRKTVSKQNARLFSFRGGMQEMVDALSRRGGGRIVTGTTVETIEKTRGGFAVTARANGAPERYECRALVLAVPAHAYGGLSFDFDFPLRAQFDKIVYPPVAVVFFGYRANPARIPLDGFGFLIPKKENRAILGTIWSSTIFPGRAPEGGVALTTFAGGSRQPEKALVPEGELVESVRGELRDLMGIDAKPDTVVVARWDKAIPQYRVGHARIIESIERFERECPGLYIGGNFRGGISVSDCIQSAKTLCERIAADLSNGDEERRAR